MTDEHNDYAQDTIDALRDELEWLKTRQLAFILVAFVVGSMVGSLIAFLIQRSP